MAEPKIDESWSEDESLSLRPFLVIGIPILIIALAVFLSCFKSCTALGEQGSKDFFDPATSPDSGFVGGANRLLAELLEDVDPDCGPAVDLETLNKKYRALTFALPYGEKKPMVAASDLRLVAINPERIKSEENRVFYYNSRLPQLLNRQASQLNETLFRIRVSSEGFNSEKEVVPIRVKSIEVVPSMFKVALVKNPWTGVIECAPNGLFSDTSTVYVAYGNSMLPLTEADYPHQIDDAITYHLNLGDGSIHDADDKPIDYYKHYKNMFDRSSQKRRRALLLKFYGMDKKFTGKHVSVCVCNGKLYVKAGCPITILGKTSMKASEKAGVGEGVPLEDGMKVVVYDSRGNEGKGKGKIGEFTVYTHDPSITLSNLILTNVGKQRFNISKEQTDLFTQQVIRGLSRNLSNSLNIDTVKVSLDPMLSREFENEIKSYLKTIKIQQKHDWQQKEMYDMSVTMMDMATGDIIASPFYTTLFDEPDFTDDQKMGFRNPALSRRYIGSTFKPLLSLAAVETNPALLTLNTQGKYSADKPSNTSSFFGYNSHFWGSPSHWNGTNFRAYLSYSDDVFPVALAAFAMTGANVNSFNKLPLSNGNMNFFKQRNGVLFMKDFAKSDDCPDYNTQPFTSWLSHLYDINSKDDFTSDTLIFQNIYKGHEKDFKNKNFGMDELCPDITNLRMDLLADGGDFRGTLVPWVLGQGNNQWSCVKMAEAWCRMLSKHAVRASLIHGDPITDLLTDNSDGKLGDVRNGELTQNEINDTWNKFLGIFKGAQSGADSGMNEPSTLKPMYDAVQKLDNNLVLFSKTGTPDAYARYEVPLLGGNKRFYDLGMYSFGLMTSQQYCKLTSSSSSQEPVHGIVCIIRVTRTYECQACSHRTAQCEKCKPFKGLQSMQARNFFSKDDARLKKFYDMTRKYY